MNRKIGSSEAKAQNYVQTLQRILPEPQSALPEARRDNTMSVVAVDGVDFVGIIELPKYDSVLPICAEWGDSSRYPCRFGGSVYDGTLQVGAITQKGQYDFYRTLSVGDRVYLTDMEGNRYSFEITGLDMRIMRTRKPFAASPRQ